jgi:hypothetical protein
VATPQIMQAESTRLRQTGADVLAGEALPGDDIGRQRIAVAGWLHALREDSHLRLGNEGDGCVLLAGELQRWWKLVSSAHTGPINFQWHYRVPAAKNKPNTDCTDASDPNRNRSDVCGASWSATKDP